MNPLCISIGVGFFAREERTYYYLPIRLQMEKISKIEAMQDRNSISVVTNRYLSSIYAQAIDHQLYVSWTEMWRARIAHYFNATATAPHPQRDESLPTDDNIHTTLGWCGVTGCTLTLSSVPRLFGSGGLEIKKGTTL